MDSKAPEKRIIVVLGMHRSGTSAVARAMPVFGIGLGDRLMPAMPGNNDKGFWEDLDVYACNQELLAHLKSTWDSLRPISRDDLVSENLAAFRQRVCDLLRNKIADHEWFGLKDPRMARLLPFWKTVFQDLGVEVDYVLAIRNPLSVAASLAKRDGFGKEKSLYLWLQHVLPAVLETNGARRAVVDFDRLMGAPEPELRRVGAELGMSDRLDEAELGAYCAGYLENGLRHARFSVKDLAVDPDVPKLATEVFQALSLAADGTLSIDSDELESAVGAYAEELTRLGPALRYISEADALSVRLRAEVAEGRSQLTWLTEVLTDRDRQAERLRLELDEQRQRLSRVEQDVAERDQKLVALQQQAHEREEILANLLAQAVADRDRMAASTSWRITRPLRATVAILRGEPRYRDRIDDLLGRTK
jgi:O-antigen biosynthesis protein